MAQLSRALLALSVFLIGLGCGGDGLITPIRVCGSIDTTDLELIQVVVTDTAGREQLSAIAASASIGEPIVLPIDTEIPASEGTGFISVEARSGGLLAARYTLRIRDLAITEPLSFPLDAECLRFDCGEGETCISGMCEMAPLPERSRECP